jgi:hypothetical protein
MRPRLNVSSLSSVATTGSCEFTSVTCGKSANVGKSFGPASLKVEGMFQIVLEESYGTPVRGMQFDSNLSR